MQKIKNIYTLTDEFIASNPWAALKSAIYNNPTELAVALAEITGLDFNGDAEQIYDWAVEYFEENGDINPLVEASQGVEIRGAKPKYGKSADAPTWNWGGFLGGVIQGIGVGLSNGFGAVFGNEPNEAAQAAAQEAARQRNIRNTILIGLAIISVVVVAVAFIKRR